MAAHSATPNPAEFPDPNTWATWIRQRSPQFKTHSSLGMTKTACSYIMRGTPEVATVDVYVYEWDPDACRWVERFHIPEGLRKDDAPIYKLKAMKAVKPPSDKALNAAIASIVGAQG